LISGISSHHSIRLAAAIGMAAALTLAAACGGGDSTSGAGGATQPAGLNYQKVVPSDRTFTVDDVVVAGAKKGKQYDVTGLPAGKEAWQIFFGPDSSNRYDVELRIYATHANAVTDGTPLAEEGTGEGMVKNKETQSWPSGAKDRWFAGGVTDVSSPGSRQAPGPRYQDFAIYGNLVMLCQGADVEQSLDRCSLLVQALGGPSLKK
jgi:hypothetical protein